MNELMPSLPSPHDPVTADWARRIVLALRSMRLSGGPGVMVSRGPDGTTVSSRNHRCGAFPNNVVLADETTTDPETGETIPEYAANIRLVVDWKYDSEDHKIKVLYGTLTLFGNALAVVPDVDGDGNVLWSDGSIESPGGPFGGNGTEAVEENY